MKLKSLTTISNSEPTNRGAVAEAILPEMELSLLNKTD